MRSKAHTALTAPLVQHHTRIYKRAMKKIIINGQMRNTNFLIVIYHSSLVKAALNAAQVCKLRNGVKKTPQFLLYSLANSGTKTIAHLSIAQGSSFWSLDRPIYDCKLRNEKKHLIQVRNEYSPQLSKLLYNCKLKNKKAHLYFKKLSEDGGQADFSKKLRRRQFL